MSRGYEGDLYCKVPNGVCSLIRPLTLGARLAFWAVVTAPNGWRHPGLYQAGPGYLADETGTDLEAAHVALGEIERAGLAMVDREARLVYVPGWAGLRSLDNHNLAIGMARDLRSLPPSPLVAAYASEVEAQLAGKVWPKLPEGFADQSQPAVALFRHHLRVGETVGRTVCQTVPQTVPRTVPETNGTMVGETDKTRPDTTRQDKEGEGAGAAPKTDPNPPPVEVKETPEARKPERAAAAKPALAERPATRKPSPESPPATAKQTAWADAMLANHGLTVDQWLARNCPEGGGLKDHHLDAIRRDYGRRPVSAAPASPRMPARDYDDPDLTPEERAAAAAALAAAKAGAGAGLLGATRGAN